MLEKDSISRIKILLKAHPKGLTITDISQNLKMNRNSTAKYLEVLLISGQVETQSFGTARVFFLTHRIPISAMLSISSHLVLTLDESKKIIFCNDHFLTFFGIARDQIVGHYIIEIYRLGVLNITFSDLFSDILVNPDHTQETAITKENETFYFHIKGINTVFDDGCRGITIVMKDVTKERKYQLELELNEARYRGIVEDQTEFICRFLPDGTLTFINCSFAKFLSRTPKDLVNSCQIAGISCEDAELWDQACKSLDRAHEVTTIECRMPDGTGRICWTAWTIRGLFDDTDVCREYQAVGRDITEKKEADARIQEHVIQMEFFSRKLQDFTELSPDADIYEAIGAGMDEILPNTIIDINAFDPTSKTLSFRAIFGKKSRKFFERLRDCNCRWDASPAYDTVPEVLASGKLFAFPGRLHYATFHQASEEVCAKIEQELNLGDFYSIGLIWRGRLLGNILFVLQKDEPIRNIPFIELYARAASIALQRRLAEDALKKSEQQYRSVIDNIQDVFYRSDRDGNLIMASPSWASVLGYDALDECLGRNIADTFYLVPVQRKEFLDAVYRDGAVRDYEVILKRKDGTPMFVAVSSHLYHDESGAVLGVEGIFRDISERHAAAEKIKNHIAQMEFFSRKLQEFLELSPASDMYVKIASDLHSLVPDALIIVNSHDRTTGNLTVRSILSDADRDTCTQHLGRCPLGLSLPVDYAFIEGLCNGRLHRLPLSLFEMCFKQIPEDICKKITASVNMGDFYSIGFVQGDEIFGNATICLYKGSGIHNLQLIETYAYLASIALQKQVAEEALNESKKKQAEEALKNSENYLLNIFNSTQSGLVVIDPETYTIFDANSTAIELIGTDKSAIVGSSCKKWFCPAENEPCPVMDLGQQIVRSECVLFNTRGERKPIIKTVVPVQLGSREYLLESFVDITERKKAEDALRESEEWLSGVVKNAPVGIAFSDSHSGIIEYINPEFERVLGYTLEENANLSTWFEQMCPDPEYRKKLYEDWMDDLHGLGGTNAYAERILRVRCKDGTEKDIWSRDVHFANGKALTIIEDFTERKRAEEALRESEERYRTLFQNVNDAIFLHGFTEEGLPGQFIGVNEIACDRLQYTRDELLRMSPHDIDAPETWAEYHKYSDQLHTEGKATFEAVHVKKDGTRVPVEISAHIFTFRDQKMVLSLVRDITERRKAKEALMESGERFRDLAGMLPQCVWECDAEGNLTFVNSHGLDMYRYESEDLAKGLTIWQTIHPDDRERVRQDVIQDYEDFYRGSHEFPGFVHYTALRKDGSTFPIETYATLTLHDNQIVGMRGMGIDITERNKAEDVLRENEERLRTILHSMPVGIFIIDAKTHTILDANPKALDMIGGSIEDVSGSVCHGFICPTESGRCPVTDLGQTVDVSERVLLTLQGETKPILKSVITTTLGGKETLIESLIDITERKRAEEALRESEARYLSLFDRSLDCVYIHDLEGNFIDANPAALALLGYTRDDISHLSLTSLISGEQLTTARERMRSIVKSGSHANLVEYRVLKKTGEFVDIEVKGSLILHGEKSYAILEIARDITERKRAEEALRQANKQLSLLSSITRHDIINQLMTLQGYLELSHTVIDKPERLKEFIKIERQAANTIANQITFTRDYQNLGVAVPAWQNVNSTIQKAVTGLPMRDVHVDIDRTDCEIFADQLFLKVFYNLIDNALRYGGDQMKIIRISSQESDTNLMIVCEDDGVGITEEDKERLFTRGFGKNTGLGLFLSREILSITGITITENGEPGKGSRFEMVVPKGSYRFTGTATK
ncbi:MAG: PAS domain S-box protein [Methanoregula sp.]